MSASREPGEFVELGASSGTIELVGGALCLDFANTVGDHKSADPNEHLGSYPALILWSGQAGILDEETAVHLLAEARRRPEQARRVYARAFALREALYHIFSAASDNSPPRTADLAILNKVLANTMAHARVVRSGQSFEWQWEMDDRALDRMLWPIARSAADLLTSEELVRVRECDNATCGWLFVDTSKNHSRRWCSMSDCGNRAKARRHYARIKSTN